MDVILRHPLFHANVGIEITGLITMSPLTPSFVVALTRRNPIRYKKSGRRKRTIRLVVDITQLPLILVENSATSLTGT